MPMSVKILIIVITSILTLIGITGWLHQLVTWGLLVAMILSYSLLLSLIVMAVTRLLSNRA
jgi:uncharacterized protein (DUF58 family)